LAQRLLLSEAGLYFMELEGIKMLLRKRMQAKRNKVRVTKLSRTIPFKNSSKYYQRFMGLKTRKGLGIKNECILHFCISKEHKNQSRIKKTFDIDNCACQ
jgi:hypothetical protein